MTNLVAENVIASAQSRVAKAEKLSGNAHPQLVNELKNLASLQLLLKNFEQAKALYWEIMNIQHRLNGPLHWSNAETLLWLGEVSEAEKQFGDAEQFYVAALWISDQNEDSDKAILGRTLVKLHGIYSLKASQEELSSRLKLEALNWRAAYSSFSKAEMSRQAVKPIHGFALTLEVA